MVRPISHSFRHPCSSNSNSHVEQNLVHLGRFLHFSQKVVGVALMHDVY